jgi:hypothetical protein
MSGVVLLCYVVQVMHQSLGVRGLVLFSMLRESDGSRVGLRRMCCRCRSWTGRWRDTSLKHFYLESLVHPGVLIYSEDFAMHRRTMLALVVASHVALALGAVPK